MSLEKKLQSEFEWLNKLPKDLTISSLPIFAGSVIEDVLLPINRRLPIEAINLSLMAKLTQVLNFKRVRVSLSPEETPLVNYYGIMFLDSGAGKDKVIGDIDKLLLSPFYRDFANKAEGYVETEKKRIEKEAEDKFGGASKSRLRQYIEDNAPRFLVTEGSNGTLEGWLSMREAFDYAGFGGTFFQNSEFNDFILKDDASRAEFLTFLKEVYEGDTKAKIIKKDKTTKPVNQIPHSMLVHSPLSGLFDNKGHKKLLSFMNTGLARRAFVSYPELVKIDYSDLDLDKIGPMRAKQKREAYKAAEQHEKHVQKILDRLILNQIVKVSDGALSLYYKYQLFCEFRASKLDRMKQEGIKAELSGRFWKALKLAAVIAVFDHPDDLKVTAEDLVFAIIQAETYGNSVNKIYTITAPDEIKQVYNFIKNQPSWVTRIEIIDQNFVNKNKFKRWFDNSLPLIEEMGMNEGYELKWEQYGKGGRRYRLDLLPFDKIDITKITEQALNNVYT